MLVSATVSGMPEFTRFASCEVKVASSCNFGFRFCAICSRMEGGKNEAKFTALEAVLLSAAAPGLAESTAMGNRPERWICTSAALRSATSSNPSTSSPERLRAL